VEKVLKVIGLVLIIGGLLLVGLIYSPVLREEANYRLTTVKSSFQKNQEIIPLDKEFGLVIPKVDINVKVFANVDANKPQEYLPLLAKGVAQAKGSQLPGQEGNVFIFAHSSDTPLNATRYNAVFYLLNKMENDDEVFIYYQENKYLYKVREKKILSPAKMGDYLKTLKGKTLTLQTCYPPGTTLKRLLIVTQEID